jgi:hypothetical protein
MLMVDQGPAPSLKDLKDRVILFIPARYDNPGLSRIADDVLPDAIDQSVC